jgi:hypothetical protein
LLVRSLQIVKEIVILSFPTRCLETADVIRLKADIQRVERVDSPPAAALKRLLLAEYANLSRSARLNPCTLALNAVMSKAGERSSVVVVSQRNHDAEALAYQACRLTRRGNAIIYV